MAPDVDENVIESVDNDSGGENNMPTTIPDGTDKFHALLEQNMAMLAQSGVIGQNNFLTTQKFADNDFMENRRHVSLVQALGAREVASKQVPAGPASP